MRRLGPTPPEQASGASATACASLAYSFFERPGSISSDATMTPVFIPHTGLQPTLDIDQLAFRQVQAAG